MIVTRNVHCVNRACVKPFLYMLAQLSGGTRDLDFDLDLYLDIIFLCASIEGSDKPEPPLLAKAISTNFHELADLYESVSTVTCTRFTPPEKGVNLLSMKNNV